MDKKYASLLDEELIAKERPDRSRIQGQLTTAIRRLAFAKALMDNPTPVAGFYAELYKTAYEAALVALEALMRHEGYKKTDRRPHVAVLTFAMECLGAEHRPILRNIMDMQTVRGEVQYGAKDPEVSPSKAQAAIDNAQKVIDLVREKITKQPRLQF